MVKKLKDLFLLNALFGFKDKATDKSFYEWKKEHSYRQITYISAVTGIVYLLLSVLNRYTAPSEISSLIASVQMFCIAPYIFLVSHLAYKKREFIFIELLLFIAPIFAASMHLYVISHLSDYNSYQTELYLMIFWIYTISGLRFIHAIVTSLAVFFIGAIGSFVLYPDQIDAFLIYITWMLVSMIFGFVGGYLLQESQKNTFMKQMELEEIAITDKLTGLYNRVMLNRTLALELEKAARYNHTIGILILDIDFFKSVNDEHGHIVGDTVLVTISRQLKKSIRASDAIFRWGGEEFIVLTPQINAEALMVLAEQLCKTVEAIQFDTIGNKTVSIGASISHKNDTVSSIVKRADEALYLAKNSGRNCVRMKKQ
jgi:diguanylate cyclase (GGDEF)-like protein